MSCWNCSFTFVSFLFFPHVHIRLKKTGRGWSQGPGVKTCAACFTGPELHSYHTNPAAHKCVWPRWEIQCCPLAPQSQWAHPHADTHTHNFFPTFTQQGRRTLGSCWVVQRAQGSKRQWQNTHLPPSSWHQNPRWLTSVPQCFLLIQK